MDMESKRNDDKMILSDVEFFFVLIFHQFNHRQTSNGNSHNNNNTRQIYCMSNKNR